jgi:hypothetical protein
VGVLIAIPLLFYPILLYLLQERLLFPLTGASTEVLQWARQTWPQSEIWLTTPDGVLLHGWYLKPSQRNKFPLLIYFGGNAEESTNFLPYRDHFAAWGILAVDYRGYGFSGGKPGEKQLFADARFLYDHFINQPEVDPNHLVAMGRSLGSGVAVYLASQRNLAGVILISPYDSIIAKDR